VDGRIFPSIQKQYVLQFIEPVLYSSPKEKLNQSSMKKITLFGIVAMLAAPLAGIGQTVIFNDTFGSSTLNGTSTPGGTPSASSTSYDVASTKAATTGPAISSDRLKLSLNGATTGGYVELQAIFASTPIQLANVGDSINMTITFTNSAGTLLAGGAKSQIDVGLFNSGGTAPLAGSLNSSGLSTATTYASGGCKGWQGYVAMINYINSASTIYTRPVQTGTTSANQDLLFSGAGSGLFTAPKGTQIGSSVTSAVTLTTGAKYTLSYTILLSAPGTISITNNLYDANGNLLSNQGGTTGAAYTYTNYDNKYDGLSIGIANSGTSYNPQMDISQITISTNYYFAPSITSLTNRTVIAGNNATLSPTVAGNPFAACQWYVSTDGGATSNTISFGTSSSLTLTNVQYSQDNYIYTLVATNIMGTSVSSMTLSVIVTPSITGLYNQAVYPNTTVAMSPTVTGVPAPALQWQLNGTNLVDGATGNGSDISGSTTGTLTITNAQVADTGTYSLVASNAAGVVTNSMSLLVSVSDVLPVITGPNNTTAIQGSSAAFTASILGLPVPTLQWLDQTQTPIDGETASTLTLANVQYSQNGYSYYIVASNSVGVVTNSAILTVQLPPTITAQPTSLVVTNTQAASFSVTALGDPSVAYQWKKNGTAISGATSSTLNFASVSAGNMGNYSVTITNQAGTTNSVSVSLTVNSVMSATAFSPANGATGVFCDQPLIITFSSAATLGSNGTVKIYNVTNPATPVDTINTALGAVQQRTFPGDNQSFSYTTIVSNGSTLTIYPHFNALASNQTYYVTIDGGAFADSAGAYFIGITDTNVWQFTTKDGPVNPANLLVAADGSGDFLTVQGAVNSIAPSNTTPTVINIPNGTYTEIVDVAGKHNITFRGQSRLGTVVGYPNNATFQSANGGTTHARMAFKVNANDITLENLSITNSTPQGGSQAEALMIETGAKRCIIDNCEIGSRQDTILANVNSSQGYFHNTTIKGNFDYIWGGGNLYFDTCQIRTISGASGYNVTAARTDTSTSQSTNTPWVNPNGTMYSANGFSFVGCTFTADSGVANITLAGNNGTAGGLDTWAMCKFDSSAYITPTETLSNSYVFWQNQNTALDGTTPVSFTYVQPIGATNDDPRLLAATNITTWFYGWTPQSAPNIISQPASQNVNAGQSVNLTVSATGIPNPAYQWVKDGTNLVGQTGATLAIPSASALDIGTYSVIVSNASGTVTSSNAVLAVAVPTTPATLTSAAVVSGGTIQFTINGAPGSAGFSYRVWASTNIALTPVISTWTLLTNDVFGLTPTVFSDDTAGEMPQRFYLITVP
jgi:hypothetical protein